MGLTPNERRSTLRIGRGFEAQLKDAATPNTRQSINIGDRLVQRDSGSTYEVTGITKTDRGAIVLLRRQPLQPEVKVSLGKEDLIKKLGTQGGPWSRA